jgi:hypothetical protein
VVTVCAEASQSGQVGLACAVIEVGGRENTTEVHLKPL